VVSASPDESIAQLEAQLDVASRTLSGVREMSVNEAERVAERMDRLASQLLEVSAPAGIQDVHERLGTVPAIAEEFDELAGWMDAADGEG
jgi:hypothetical protein